MIQEGLRFQIPVIQFYKNDERMAGKDPVQIIREAVVKTLVHCYPFAGRLREGPDRKLLVECTGEGVMFIEANTYVTLDQLGDALQPPFPGLEVLLYDVLGSSDILNCPQLLIQVRRLFCYDFILRNAGGGLHIFLSDTTHSLYVYPLFLRWRPTSRACICQDLIHLLYTLLLLQLLLQKTQFDAIYSGVLPAARICSSNCCF